MISLTTNTRGSTAMKSLQDMNITELTAKYNSLPGVKQVKKLRDLKTGIVKINKILGVGKKSEKPAKKSDVQDTRSKISQEFDCRAGTNREKLVEALGAAKGKQVLRKDLLKAVYGNQKEENVAKLGMVMKGVEAMIKDGKLKYTVERQKDADTKEVSLGLLAK